MYQVMRLNDSSSEDFDDETDAIDHAERLSILYGDPVTVYTEAGSKVGIAMDGEWQCSIKQGKKLFDADMAYLAIRHTDDKVVGMVVANHFGSVLELFNETIEECYFERVTTQVARDSWLKKWQGHGQPALEIPKQMELFQQDTQGGQPNEDK